MTDIAEIGFKTDTSGLSDATAKLDKLSPAAAKVEGNVDRLNRTMERLIVSMERSTSRVSRGVSANDNLGKSYKKLSAVMKRVNDVTGVSSKAAVSQNMILVETGKKIDTMRQKYNPLFAVIKKYKENIQEIKAANALGVLSIDEMTTAISRQRTAALTAMKSIRDFNNETASYSSRMSELRQKFDPLYAAEVRHQNSISEISKAYKIGALSANGMIQAMEQQNALHRNSVANIKNNIDALQKLNSLKLKSVSVSDAVNKSTGVSNKSAMSQGASYDMLGKKISDLRAKHNPLFAVIQQYKMNVAEIRNANSLGALSVNEMTQAIAKQRRAALTAIGAIKGNAKAIERYGQKSGIARHNVGNLAAQFQDIGVTAAMGMNPLMVALQQGTQISAVLGPLGMAGAVKSLGAAIKAVISPMALMTIALTALAVVGIQMVEWSQLAKNSLNAVADVLPTVAKYATLAGAGLMLMYAPTIIRGAAALPGMVLMLSKRLWGVTAALAATIGLPALLVAGLVAIVAAANVFRDDLTRMLGFDVVAAAKKGVNFTIGVFVGGYNAIVKTWAVLPLAFQDIAISAANGALKQVMKFVNKTRVVLNALPGVTLPVMPEDMSLIKNRFKGVAGVVGDVFTGEFKTSLEKDYVGTIVDATTNAANKAGAKLRKIASGISTGDDKEKKNSFARIVSGSESDSQSVRAEIQGLNLSAAAARSLKNETDLLNKARNAGIKLTPTQTEQLKDLASVYTTLQNTLENGKFMKQMTTASEANVISLQAEREALGLVGQELEKFKVRTAVLAAIKKADVTITDEQTQALLKQAEAVAILKSQTEIDRAFNNESSALKESVLNQQTEIEALGMSKEAAAALRFERKLLNDEMFRGIQYSPTQLENLKSENAQLNRLIETYSKMKDRITTAKRITKGFFFDLKNDISQGVSAIKAFGNAFLNALNKIADKILDSAIDDLFSNLFGNLKGGGIAKLFGFAKGGAFEADSQKFAKGGAFTNSIVDKPTLFQFAKGAKMGEMGEAGPEAIMPLKRGRDGSLGVQMYGQPAGASKSSEGGNISMPITINADGADSAALEKVVTEVRDLKENFPRYMRNGQREINNMGG